MLVPPGEVLLEEFLRPMGISQYRLALAIGVPESRINAIVKGRRAITADTDLRLCRFFGLSDGFWLRMQGSHDLKLARQALICVLPAIEPIQTTPATALAARLPQPAPKCVHIWREDRPLRRPSGLLRR